MGDTHAFGDGSECTRQAARQDIMPRSMSEEDRVGQLPGREYNTNTTSLLLDFICLNFMFISFKANQSKGSLAERSKLRVIHAENTEHRVS